MKNHYTINNFILFAKNALSLQRQNFDTTSEFDAANHWWAQQNLKTMKQTTNNSKNTMNKETIQKRVIKSQKAETNARRKFKNIWAKVENTPRYRSTSVKEVCDSVTKKIEVEVLDGIFLKLSIKSQAKSTSAQNRILRRIVEKRQAQAYHKKYGRTEDLTSIHVSITSTSRCMEAIRKKRFAS